MNPKHFRTYSFLTCIVVYGASLGVAFLVGYLVKDEHPLVVIGMADLAATLVVFICSFIFRNSSLYDPYWSVIPIVIVAYLWWYADSDANFYRQLIVAFLVAFWGARLTFNWVRGWRGLHAEDWRYRDLAAKTGKMYWLVSFSGIHLFPTILVYMGCLPLLPAMTSSQPLGIMDGVAAFITLGAVLLELISDQQLWNFKMSKKGPGKFLQGGVWSYSRHPNYFGEVMFWVGLFCFSLGLSSSEFGWTGIGALSMLILFWFISIPMMDKRHVARRPGYEDYMTRVSSFIPWFPQKKGVDLN